MLKDESNLSSPEKTRGYLQIVIRTYISTSQTSYKTAIGSSKRALKSKMINKVKISLEK